MVNNKKHKKKLKKKHQFIFSKITKSVDGLNRVAVRLSSCITTSLEKTCNELKFFQEHKCDTMIGNKDDITEKKNLDLEYELTLLNNQNLTPNVYALRLLIFLFKLEELIDPEVNLYGTYGKKPLDQNRIKVIKDIIDTKFGYDVWKACSIAINSKLRGLKSKKCVNI